ncbi:MAG: sodium-dependent transporter [Coriobacteriales bacterium]
MPEENREHFASRIGFILVAAGCAIGIGNVWRFPYITGEYGGAAFVLLYLIFLVILGLPVLVMEFSVGRASQKSAAQAFDILIPSRRYHWFGWWGYIGCMILMMFYTVVAGWMLAYIPKLASGQFTGASVETTSQVFASLCANPAELIFWMVVAIVIGFAICAVGLQKGVERVTKVMMAALFVIMLLLCVRAVTLPGAGEGVAFYLLPDFSHLFAGDTASEQWGTFGEAVYAAMGQAFFSLSLGISAMEVLGSRVGSERSLTGESVNIAVLNTIVAILAGLIIFPACLAYGVSPDSGPSLVFVTLPMVFGQMPLGNVWGALFFVLMSFASLSTVIAVFENLVGWSMDKWDMQRGRAVMLNAVLVFVLSLPCALGFNVWSGVGIPGIGDIQSIEDFIVSNNMLPIGSLVFVIICTRKHAWGWDNFVKEADKGEGLAFPKRFRLWYSYGIPALIIVIFVMGYVPKIAGWMGLG